MASVAWETLYPEIMPMVNGCPSPIVDNAIRNATIELCDFGLMYREDIDPVVTEAGVAEYDLDLGSSVAIAEIISARTDSRRLDPKTTEDLSSTGSVFEAVTGGGPVAYYQIGPNTLRLYPIPDGVYTVYVTAAMKPSRKATGCESYVMDKYRDGIVAGALSRLLIMPMAWSNPTYAVQARQMFVKEMGQAKADGMKNFTMASPRVMPRAFR